MEMTVELFLSVNASEVILEPTGIKRHLFISSNDVLGITDYLDAGDLKYIYNQIKEQWDNTNINFVMPIYKEVFVDTDAPEKSYGSFALYINDKKVKHFSRSLFEKIETDINKLKGEANAN